MMLKRRKLDLEGRLNRSEANENKIKFDRLPRKKVKPFWWLLAMFLVVLYLLYFLKKFY